MTDDGSSNLDTAGFEKSPIDIELGDASPLKDKEDDPPSNPDKMLATKNDKKLSGPSFDKKDDVASEEKEDDGSSNPDADANKKLPTEKDKNVSGPSFDKQDNGASDAEKDDAGVGDAINNESVTAPAKKELLALGHKKRALKQHRSNFTSIISSTARVTVTDFEKAVYYEGVKRPKRVAERITCAEIGRMSIMHGEFSEAMAGKKWVGTFTMNVFCEALNYDLRESGDTPVKKGYLTSAEVDKMKVLEVGIDLLRKKLDPRIVGFNITKMDMVFMPVCDGNHWWLVVANMRDNRFDILSSLPIRDEERLVTQNVRANFEKVFASMKGEDNVIDFKKFPSSAQSAPEQQTISDCGIYVMNFMVSWDGRQLPSIHSDDIYYLRVKYGAFILTHRGNEHVLPSIQKLLKNKPGAEGKKRRIVID